SLALNGAINGSGFGLTLDVEPAATGQDASLASDGGISNVTSLTKTGGGPSVLFGVNSYTGPTLINAGTLLVGAGGAVPSTSAVTVAAGASFDLNNFNDTIGALAGSGTVSLGSGTLSTDGTGTPFTGTINGPGGITKIGGGTLNLAGVNAYTGPTTAK